MEYDIKAIGNKAFAARAKKNLKQYDVSKAIGIHQATYSKFESGNYDIRLSELIKLCNYLDVKISWLTDEIDDDFTPEEEIDIEKFKLFIKFIRKKF